MEKELKNEINVCKYASSVGGWWQIVNTHGSFHFSSNNLKWYVKSSWNVMGANIKHVACKNSLKSACPYILSDMALVH